MFDSGEQEVVENERDEPVVAKLLDKTLLHEHVEYLIDEELLEQVDVIARILEVGQEHLEIGPVVELEAHDDQVEE